MSVFKERCFSPKKLPLKSIGKEIIKNKLQILKISILSWVIVQPYKSYSHQQWRHGWWHVPLCFVYWEHLNGCLSWRTITTPPTASIKILWTFSRCSEKLDKLYQQECQGLNAVTGSEGNVPSVTHYVKLGLFTIANSERNPNLHQLKRYAKCGVSIP